MIEITEASAQDFPAIQAIAYKTWPVTYGHILSKEQLDYMLYLMYSTESLQKSAAKGHQLLLLKEDNAALGFASYEHNYLDKNVTRLHKLYMLPESQGKGAGKMLIETIEKLAKENGSDAVSLNVNKFNNAFSFYKKAGYEVVGEEDIEIGRGYLMEDYKMEKQLP